MSKKRFEKPGEDNAEALDLHGDQWELPAKTDLGELTNQSVDELEKRIRALGWTDEAAEDVSLGFREAIVNARKYGYPGESDKENGVIHVELALSPETVEITIRDDGKGFDYLKVADPTTHEGLDKTSGRGIFLMNSFFDEVSYNDQGNEVTLTKKRNT